MSPGRRAAPPRCGLPGHQTTRGSGCASAGRARRRRRPPRTLGRRFRSAGTGLARRPGAARARAWLQSKRWCTEGVGCTEGVHGWPSGLWGRTAAGAQEKAASLAVATMQASAPSMQLRDGMWVDQTGLIFSSVPRTREDAPPKAVQVDDRHAVARQDLRNPGHPPI